MGKSWARFVRGLRIVAAGASLLAMTALFAWPVTWIVRGCGWLPRIQLVPAVAAGSVLVLVGIAVSVALCGRLYCSVVCPLGIAQDLVRGLARLAGIRKTARLGTESRGLRLFRRVVLALFVVGVPLGLTGLFEPYGIYGRFCVSAFARPVGLPLAVVVWGVAVCALILVASAVWPRAWCNVVCPVGTFLGLFAGRARFRVRIDRTKCVNCNLCVKACDKGCISSDKEKKVNHSRCVSCLACAGTCGKGALTWR